MLWARRIGPVQLQPKHRELVRMFSINHFHHFLSSTQYSYKPVVLAPGPVQNLMIQPRSSESAYLYWTQPLNPNGQITGYEITYQLLNRFIFHFSVIFCSSCKNISFALLFNYEMNLGATTCVLVSLIFPETSYIF